MKSAWPPSRIRPKPRRESTIVEIPVPITLREPGDGKFGIRLRLSVFFAWNNVRFLDLEGDDIAASLKTLTIVPGVEFLIPVGEHWMVRPYAQIGWLDSLDVPGQRWMASLGSRASGVWRFDRWVLSTGGRLEYTAVFNEDWRKTDDVSFVDLGADFSFPLWFNVKGERAAMGFFVIPALLHLSGGDHRPGWIRSRGRRPHRDRRFVPDPRQPEDLVCEDSQVVRHRGAPGGGPPILAFLLRVSVLGFCGPFRTSPAAPRSVGDLRIGEQVLKLPIY